MSSNHGSDTRGNVARDEDSSSMVAKLAKELDGVLDLNNTENVTHNTRYAPAVTKEVVKPVVHEQIEEHITRETHTHDHYTKILPVRDVEVLPARHWVPGPDGRLIQVDEKDVYSGAAFNQGQASTVEVTEDQQHVNLERVNQDQASQTRESHSSQHADTVKHVSVNPPKVVPAQVNQVYQTQVHQPELDRQYVSVGQVEDQGQISQISHGSHRSSNPIMVSHREVSPSQTHQGEVHHHNSEQHQIPRKPVDYGRTQGYITPLRQQTVNQHSVSEREAGPRHTDEIRQSQAHRHPVVGHEVHRHQENQGYTEPSAKRHEGSQGQVHSRHIEQGRINQGQMSQDRGIHQRHQQPEPDSERQVDEHQGSRDQTNNDPLSPGLLDPYRVKNGPVHHDPSDPTSKPLPDLPETSVQTIAGHKILTTEDHSGHTRLHKEPKDSKRSFH